MGYVYLDESLRSGDDREPLFTVAERWMKLPVLGNPDPTDPTQTLPVVSYRSFYRPKAVAPDERLAYVELDVDPVGDAVSDAKRYLFLFRPTKQAAPGDVVVVLHEHKLAVRRYEPQENGQVCLRSAVLNCPTWILPALAVNLQGVAIIREIDVYDSGWA